MITKPDQNKTLAKVSKLLKIDLGFYIQSVTWSGLSHASTVIRGVATTFLMARYLPPVIFGEFRYVLALFGLAGAFTLAGMTTSIIKGIGQGDTVVVRIGIKKIFRFSFISSLLLFVFGTYKFYVGDTSMGMNAYFLSFIFPFYSVASIFQPILIGKQEIKRVSKLTAVANSLFAVLFVIVLFYTRKVLFLLIGYFLIDIIIKGFLTWRTVKETSDAGDGSKHLHTGSHISVINILLGMVFQLDQFLIQHFFGYVSLAKFNIAVLIPDQIKDFASYFSNIILRRFSNHKNSQKVLQNTRRHYWIVFGLSAALATTYSLLAPVFIHYLFPQYQDQIQLSVLYAFSLICLASFIGANFFQAHNMVRSLWIMYGFNAVIQLVANIFFIPLYGGAGAIYSKIASRILSMPLGYPRLEKSGSTDKDPDEDRPITLP